MIVFAVKNTISVVVCPFKLRRLEANIFWFEGHTLNTPDVDMLKRKRIIVYSIK